MAAIDALLAAARRFAAKDWLMGTSGNLSVRLDDGRILITASGVDKGDLRAEDLLLLDAEGTPLGPASGSRTLRSSAETSIHLAVFRSLAPVTAVYHVHSPYVTWLSTTAPIADTRKAAGFGREPRPATTGANAQEPLQIVEYPGGPQGWEMIKGYGLWEAGDVGRLPIFANHMDVPGIARDLEAYLLREQPRTPAMLIAGHGQTSWGGTPAEALRHTEVTEFLAGQSWLAAAR